MAASGRKFGADGNAEDAFPQIESTGDENIDSLTRSMAMTEQMKERGGNTLSELYVQGGVCSCYFFLILIMCAR